MTLTEVKSYGESTDSLRRAQRKLVLCRVSKQAYAIPLEPVQEILPMSALSHPPCLPAVLAGFLNLGGELIPVVRLDRLFGLPCHTPDLFTPLLLVRSFDSVIAYLVEQVTGIVTIAASSVLPVPEECTFNACAEGVIVDHGDSVILLNPARILTENEARRICELSAMEQTRLQQSEDSSR